MNLSILEGRLLSRIPSQYHEDIVREINKFEIESERMSEQEHGVGQATLTKSEIARLPIGNQNTNTLTLIQYQVIKAHAIENGVTDWVSKVDSTLSKRENIQIMKQENINKDRNRSKGVYHEE